MKSWILLTALALLAFGCKKGELLPNEAPETHISISQINLSGPDRLTSEVTLHWFGTDVDGYVKGYEISFDEVNWHYMTEQDSTFNFSLSANSDTVDINFWVRAIDNQDLVDLTPAFLLIPIKNSPPVVKFDSTQAINDTTYIVSTAVWSATDPDGDATLDSLFIRINNGAWRGLSVNTTVMTFVPTDPTVSGAVNCNLFPGTGLTQLSGTIDGLLLEGNNRIYLKARDVAGAESELDSTDIFYTKRKTSDLLLVNSNSGGSSPTPDEVYFPIITTVAGNFDYINIVRNSRENIPALWNPTFLFMLNQYDKVFWYADESAMPNTDLIIEAAASVIQEYLSQGGKLLFSAKFPADLNKESTITGFSPLDSLSSSTGQARLTTDSACVALPAFSANYPNLIPSSFITGADPYYTSDTANVIYQAQITPVSGWVGPRNVASRTEISGGRTNQVFFSLELHKLNGDPNALQSFFDQVLNNEFNW